jgi:hypothetical protein
MARGKLGHIRTIVALFAIVMLAVVSPARAQVWKPHKRTATHAKASPTSKTRKPEPQKSKLAKPKIDRKKSKHRAPAKKARPKKHHRSDDDFTIIEEDYPAN